MVKYYKERQTLVSNSTWIMLDKKTILNLFYVPLETELINSPGNLKLKLKAKVEGCKLGFLLGGGQYPCPKLNFLLRSISVAPNFQNWLVSLC